MRRRPQLLAIAGTAALLALGTLTAAAGAAGGNAIINDCLSNGRLTQHYTPKEIRQALAQMSASTKQYTSCQDVLQNALLHPNSLPGGSGSGGGGSFLPTPVIIVLVVLVLGAVTFGALAVRRRRTGADGTGPDDAGVDGPGPEGRGADGPRPEGPGAHGPGDSDSDPE